MAQRRQSRWARWALRGLGAAALAALSCMVASRAWGADTRGADAAFAAGEDERAEALYEELVRGDCRDAHVYRNLAVLYDRARRGGRYTAQAEAHYRRSLELAPDDPTTHHRLALHLEREGRTEEALAEVRRVVALAPRNAGAWFDLGRLLASLNAGEPGEVEGAWRQAIALDAGLGEAYLRLGRWLRGVGRNGEARTILEKGKALPPREGQPEGQPDADDFEFELEFLEN